MRRTNLDDGLRVDAGSVLGNGLDERVGENVLCDGDGDGAAEGVEEHDDRICK